MNILQTLPPGLADILTPEDGGSLLRALCTLADLLKTERGVAVLASCEYLDTSADVERNPPELREQVVHLFTFIAMEKQFLPAMQLLVFHCAALFNAGYINKKSSAKFKLRCAARALSNTERVDAHAAAPGIEGLGLRV